MAFRHAFRCTHSQIRTEEFSKTTNKKYFCSWSSCNEKPKNENPRNKSHPSTPDHERSKHVCKEQQKEWRHLLTPSSPGPLLHAEWIYDNRFLYTRSYAAWSFVFVSFLRADGEQVAARDVSSTSMHLDCPVLIAQSVGLSVLDTLIVMARDAIACRMVRNRHRAALIIFIEKDKQ